jgi:serine/threonine protein phosphatase PrpC
MVRASAVSHPGVCPVNEDCYLCQEDFCLFVVADGMGGHAAGEALAQGTHHNVTALVVRYEGEA